MEDRNHAWDGPKQLTENSGKTPCRSYVARVEEDRCGATSCPLRRV